MATFVHAVVKKKKLLRYLEFTDYFYQKSKQYLRLLWFLLFDQQLVIKQIVFTDIFDLKRIFLFFLILHLHIRDYYPLK